MRWVLIAFLAAVVLLLPARAYAESAALEDLPDIPTAQDTAAGCGPDTEDAPDEVPQEDPPDAPDAPDAAGAAGAEAIAVEAPVQIPGAADDLPEPASADNGSADPATAEAPLPALREEPPSGEAPAIGEASVMGRPPAGEAPVADGVYVLRTLNAEREVLDVTGASEEGGANAEIWSSNGGGNQRWEVSSQEDGTYTLRSVLSGLLLDVSGASAEEGANVIQWADNGGANQRWRFTASVGGWSIASALSDSLVLDVAGRSKKDGGNVIVWSPNGGANQVWELVPADAEVDAGAEIESGYYRLVSSDGTVLDITRQSVAVGGSVGLYAPNGGANQIFRVSTGGDGHINIENGATGLYVSASGSDPIPGSKVTQQAGAGSDARRFSAEKSGDGYVFRNVANGLYLAGSGSSVISGSDATAFLLDPVADMIAEGLYRIAPRHAGGEVLDVSRASMADGAPVIQYSPNGGFNQKWEILSVGGTENTCTIQSLNSGLYLADAGGDAVQRADAAAASCQWIPIPMGDGFSLRNAATGLVLDIGGASTSDAARACTWEAHGGANQRFSLSATVPLADGRYEIRFAQDGGQLVGVSGANVASSADDGSTSQVWYASRNGDGTYAFVNVHSGKALEIAVGGNVVQQAASSSSASQRWNVGYNHDGTFSLVPDTDPTLALGIAGGAAPGSGRNIRAEERGDAGAQQLRFVSAPGKRGWQNPAGYPQVSRFDVVLPSYADGYVMPSRISADATRSDCIETLIAVAYEYRAAGSWWRDNTVSAPGGPIDCTGLVLEGLYACGMSLDGVRGGDYNPTTKATTKPYFSNEWRYHGTFKPVSSPRRGDIVYFDGHVGIYLGDGSMIDSTVLDGGGIGIHSIHDARYGGVLGYGRPFV